MTEMDESDDVQLAREIVRWMDERTDKWLADGVMT